MNTEKSDELMGSYISKMVSDGESVGGVGNVRKGKESECRE